MQEAGPGPDLDRHVEKGFCEFEDPHFGPGKPGKGTQDRRRGSFVSSGTQDTKQAVEIGDERQEKRWWEMWRKQERRKMEKEARRRNSRREEREQTRLERLEAVQGSEWTL